MIYSNNSSNAYNSIENYSRLFKSEISFNQLFYSIFNMFKNQLVNLQNILVKEPILNVLLSDIYTFIEKDINKTNQLYPSDKYIEFINQLLLIYKKRYKGKEIESKIKNRLFINKTSNNDFITNCVDLEVEYFYLFKNNFFERYSVKECLLLKLNLEEFIIKFAIIIELLLDKITQQYITNLINIVNTYSDTKVEVLYYGKFFKLNHLIDKLVESTNNIKLKNLQLIFRSNYEDDCSEDLNSEKFSEVKERMYKI